MALSDTCADALNELQRDFVDYADWNYNPVELNRIINAMYELSEFVIRQDLPPDTNLDNLQEIIDRVVVASILDMAEKEGVTVICQVLADVAKINTKLEKSIKDMLKKLTSKEGLFDVIKTAQLIGQLKNIDKLIKEK